MSIDDLIGGVLGGSGSSEDTGQDAGNLSAGPAGGTGGIDLGALFASLLGGGTESAPGASDLGGVMGGAGGIDLGTLFGNLLGGAPGSGSPQLGGTAGEGGDLGALLGGLLGGGSAAAPGASALGGLLGALAGASGGEPPAQPGLDVNSLAEGIGVGPSVIQAAIPLVVGGLLSGSLPRRMGDEPLDEAAVRASGVPRELALKTGLDLPKAVLTVQQILELLRQVTKPLGASGTHKPAQSSKPARRKKPRSQSGSSHAASTTRPKRPKSSASTSHAGHEHDSTAAKPAKRKSKPKPPSTARPRLRRRTTSASESPD